MNRLLLVATGAILFGFGTGEYLTKNFSFRRWVSQVVRRGKLKALVERRGICQSDVERAWQRERFAAGTETPEAR